VGGDGHLSPRRPATHAAGPAVFDALIGTPRFAGPSGRSLGGGLTTATRRATDTALDGVLAQDREANALH
jgi:hypothetical protein